MLIDVNERYVEVYNYLLRTVKNVVNSTSNILTRGVVCVRGHHFVRGELNNSSVVFDLGAHLAEFTRQLDVRWGCNCLAVEANTSLFLKIQNRINALNAAVSTEDGEVDFFIYSNLEESSLYSEKINRNNTSVLVQSISLESLLKMTGVDCIDLIKMDIEGAEIKVLLQTPEKVIKRCKQITVEFHDFCVASISKTDVIKVIERMKSLDFQYISFSRSNTDVLFINNSCFVIKKWEYFYVKYFLRFILAIGRLIKRQIIKTYTRRKSDA